ncbi:MAG: hypothetical protein R8K20_07535, partial [Gallionellaceae bacterium]
MLKKVIIIFMFATLSFANLASADSPCQRVQLNVTNDISLGGNPQQIRVMQLNYFDFNDNR